MALFSSLFRWLGLSRAERNKKHDRRRTGRRLTLEALESREMLNAAPILPVLDDRVFSHTASVTVTLNGSDADGDSLTYSAKAFLDTPAHRAHQQDQALGLYGPGNNYYVNLRGQSEKYLQGDGGRWFYILPTGALYQWGGSIAASTLITTLDRAYWLDPALLTDAQPVNPVNQYISLTGTQLTFTDQVRSFAGALAIEVSVSDGLASAQRTFRATVTNTKPTLAGIADQTFAHGVASLPTITLQGDDADAADRAGLTYTARAYADNAAYRAYLHDQALGLTDPGNNYYTNFRGQNEKYFQGNGGLWYYILPSGSLYQWGGSIAASTLVTTLDPSYWTDPVSLWNAQSVSSLTGYVNVSGNQLSFTDLVRSYPGSLYIDVTVSDGIDSARQAFKTTVTNNKPTLAGIADVTFSHAVATLPAITLQGDDADAGDRQNLAYTVQAFVDSAAYRAYQQDQALGLYAPGNNYYFNYRGQSEKYLQGNGGLWYYILPTGALYQWGGSFAASTLITTLDESYWIDPLKLCNAAPVSPAAGYISLSGNQITFTNQIRNYAGTLYIDAGVSDGIDTARRSFKATVTNATPVLPAFADLTASHGPGLNVTLAATDADAADTITYSARVLGYDAAYEVVRQYGLRDPGNNFYPNAHGANEKWLLGNNGAWYALLPNGELRAWTGASISSAVLARLSTSHHTNPYTLLNTPAPAAPPVTAAVAGNQLTFTPNGYTGTFKVEVTAGDGIAGSTGSFLVTLTNLQPVMSAITDRFMSHTTDRITVSLSGSDGDNDSLAYSARVVGSAPVVLSVSGNHLAIDPAASYAGAFQVEVTADDGYGGKSSTTFSVTVTNAAPELDFISDRSQSHTLGAIAVDLTGRDEDNDSLTYGARVLGGAPVGINVAGNRITLTPAPNYAGTFQVEAWATDGIVTTKRTFQVTVTNILPVLNAIADRTVSHTEGPIAVDVAGSDADNDPLTYDMRVVGNAAVTVTRSGTRFTLTPAASYAGTFQVEASVSDGMATTTRYFQVTVTNAAPALEFVADRSVPHTFGPISLELNGTDADNDTLSYGAQLVGNPPVTLSRSENHVSLTPASNYAGTYQVEVWVTDGIATTRQTFQVTITNAAPVLQGVTNQTVPHAQRFAAVSLDATDADGDALTYSARLIGTAPVALTVAGNQVVATPADGYAGTFQVEISATDGIATARQTFQVTFTNEAPTLEALAGRSVSHADGPVVVALSAADADSDTLTYSARLLGSAAVGVQVTGSQLTLTPSATYLGSFDVEVTVRDGYGGVATRTFQVSVTNAAPILTPVADVSFSHTQDEFGVGLQARDADHDSLTYSAVVRGYSKEYELVQQLGLHDPGNGFYANYRGQGEKYFIGANSQWYFILPTGAFHRWGTSVADSTLLTMLDVRYHTDPRSLLNTTIPVAPAVAVTVTGNRLEFNPPAGYLGTFKVEATARDRFAGDTQAFLVSIVNAAPVLEKIPDLAMTQTQGQAMVDLSVTDADGDAVTLSARAVGYSQAYTVKTELGLIDPGNNYYFNFRGQGEKYLLGDGSQWYYLLPSGALYQWNGSFAASTLVTPLDAAYHADPRLLLNATQPSAPPVTVTVNGTQVTISGAAGYSGAFEVQVTASDAIASSTHSFMTSVTKIAAQTLTPDSGDDNDRLTRSTQLTVAGQGQAGLGFTLQLDGQSIGSYQVAADGTWSASLPGTLGEGTHRLKILPQDGSLSSTFTFVVDTTAAQLAITPQLYNQGDPTPVLVLASDANGIASQIAFDVDLNGNGNFSDPGERDFHVANLTSGNEIVELPPLGLGNRLMRARLKDLAGNEATSANATVIGPTATTAQVQLPASTADAVYVAQITAVAGLRNSFQPQVYLEIDLNHDGQFTGDAETNYAQGLLDAEGNASISFHGLYYGSYQVRARILDRAELAVYSPLQSLSIVAPDSTSGGWFEPNFGQIFDPDVQYLARSKNAVVYLAPNVVGLFMQGPTSQTDATQASWLQRIRLLNSNLDATALQLSPLSSVSNYASAAPVYGVPNFQQLMYQNVYAGVDWVFRLNRDQLQFDFVVNPGANIGEIQFELPDVIEAEIDANGQLVLTMPNEQKFYLTAPLAYQPHASGPTAVKSWFTLSNGRVGFGVEGYDPTRQLVIDPFVYQAFVGTGGNESAGNLALDNNGNVYVVYTTPGGVQANLNTVQPVNSPFPGASDAVVTKIDVTGQRIIWSTYIGGTSTETGDGISVDPAGNVYITGSVTLLAPGYTGFPLYPLTSPANIIGGPGANTTDVLVAKLDPNGNLIYTTIIGNAGNDRGVSIAVNGFGRAFVTGTTANGGAPFAGPADIAPGGGAAGGFATGNIFVFQLNEAGNDFYLPPGAITKYARTIGTGNTESVFSIVVDDFDSAYIVGGTTNAGSFSNAMFSFTPNIFGAMGGGSDAYLIKLNPQGLIAHDVVSDQTGYAVLLGNQGLTNPPVGPIVAVSDDARGLAVDATGAAYIAGNTGTPTPGNGRAATIFPVPRLAYGNFINPSPRTDVNVYLAKINPPNQSGQTSINFMSVLNTTPGNIAPPAANAQPTESANGVSLDTFGNIYVYGSWDGRAIQSLFPVSPYNGGPNDAFVVAFDPTGSQILLTQTIGGGGDDEPSGTTGNGIVVDVTGDIIVMGQTTAAFGGPGTILSPPGGATDIFVSRIRGFTTVIGDDRFEPNDTADVATFIGTLQRNRQINVGNLTTAFHNDGTPDYDWFVFQAAASGTLQVDINRIRVFASGPSGTLGAGGDLNLRVFRLNGITIEDVSPASGFGSPGFLVNSGFQTIITSANAGDIFFVDVNPFNFSQATYGLRVRLF